MQRRIAQRWRRRRSTFRVPGDAIKKPRFDVDILAHKQAKAFVLRHHYSKSYPAERLAVGLFEGRRLLGVATFSVPMSGKAIEKRAGAAAELGVDLGRFVLLDEVPFNSESWFLSRAFSVLKTERPELQAVIAYSDPVARKTKTGRVIMPGHVGVIYQAHNGRFVGRSSPRSLYLAPDGRAVAPRALSKLRNSEQGARYAYQHLLELGAPKRQRFEDDRSYAARAIEEGPFVRVRHPGNYVYAWALTRRARAKLPSGSAYPRKPGQLTLGF